MRNIDVYKRQYLNHNFYQEQHITGCVFADSSAVPLAVDNTVLYLSLIHI